MPAKTCFNCGEVGHIRPNCPYLNGGGQQGHGGGGSRGGGNYYYQGGGGNRFQALSQSGASNSGRPQQSRGNEEVPPNEVVTLDMETELPIWKLSSYSHARGGRNDLTGDASVEEVRWAQYQERMSGTPDFQMRSNFGGALVAKDREIKALIRAHLKPSLGGRPIHEHNPWLDSITGRASTSFGHQPAAAANLFGQPAPFGQPSAGTPPMLFGQPTQLPAGGPQMLFRLPTQPPALSPPVPFGQPTQPPPASPLTLFGQPSLLPAAVPPPSCGQSTQPPAASLQMLFGQPIHQPPIFGAPTGGGPAGFGADLSGFGAGATGFGGPSSAAPVTFGGAFAALGSAPAVTQQPAFGAPSPPGGALGGSGAPAPYVQAGASTGGVKDDAVAQFRAPAFTRGKIPDTPPSLQLCA